MTLLLGTILAPILGGSSENDGILDSLLGAGQAGGGVLGPIIGGGGTGLVGDLLDGLLGGQLQDGSGSLVEDVLANAGELTAGDDLVAGLLSPLLDPLADIRIMIGSEMLVDTGTAQGSGLTLDLNLLNPNGALLGVDGTLLGLNLGAVLGGASLLDVDIDPSTDPGDGTPPGPGGPGAPDDPDAYEVQLIGSAMRDSFIIGRDSTFVAGLGEVDTVIYAQNAGEFTYSIGMNAIVLTDDVNSDYLSSIERIKFFDGTMALDTGLGENAGFAYRLYAAALNRTPDSPGLEYWIDRVDRGDNRTDIASGFVNSVEFRMAYGTNLDNGDFVETLYRNVLDRTPEAQGLSFWIGQLNAGASRGSVLAGISESAENVEATRDDIGDFIFIA